PGVGNSFPGVLEGGDGVPEDLAPHAGGDRIGVGDLGVFVDDAAALPTDLGNEYPLSIGAAGWIPLFLDLGAGRGEQVVARKPEVGNLIRGAIHGRENRFLVSRDVDAQPHPRPDRELAEERGAVGISHLAKIEPYSRRERQPGKHSPMVLKEKPRAQALESELSII